MAKIGKEKDQLSEECLALREQVVSAERGNSALRVEVDSLKFELTTQNRKQDQQFAQLTQLQSEATLLRQTAEQTDSQNDRMLQQLRDLQACLTHKPVAHPQEPQMDYSEKD